MDEFGHILREARETKGLTLSDVQDQIRINSRFLDALERGEYDVIPAPAHVRGFLRNYARFLGLDPQPLIARYERVLEQGTAVSPDNAQEEETNSLQISPRQDQPFFNPVNFAVDDGRTPSSESILRLVIIIALIAALALVANRFIPMFTDNRDGSEAITEGITEAIQNVADQIGPTAEPTETADENAAATDDAGIISTSRNIEEGTAVPAPLPTRPILPAMETIQLKLEITERTWMEVTVDGDIVYSGIVKKGDPPYEWEAGEEAKVNTGNAIAVHVTINDIPWGRMGERGENKEEIWRTTQ
ncbi:MAG: helix-turn-helix domain-containing protein [Chloroflexi bacterium]|nr:helix-turn-helix domain-containing protein [Chloroflexota bacterium]